jgi:hypothetical protein
MHDGALDPPPLLNPTDASSRNLNAPSSRHASVPSSRGSFLDLGRPQAAAQSSSNAQPASNDRPNNPLTPIPAYQRSTLPNTLASPTTAKSRHRVRPLTDSANLTWSRSRLDKERKDWWDTRVTGSQEVWSTLRVVVDYLQRGEIETAQGLLDAQECTCPDGQLWKGVYDDTGVIYKIPEWVVIEPSGLVEEDEAAEIPTRARNEASNASDHDQDLGLDDTEFVVRARISTTAGDVRVQVRRRETIASIREKLKTQAKVRLYVRYMSELHCHHISFMSLSQRQMMSCINHLSKSILC